MADKLDYIMKNVHISGFGHNFYITETEEELLSSLKAICRMSSMSVECFPEMKGNGVVSAKKYVLRANNFEIMTFLVEKPVDVYFSQNDEISSKDRRLFETRSNKFYLSALKVDVYAWACSSGIRYKIPLDTILNMAKASRKLTYNSVTYDRVFPFYYKRSRLWASDIFKAYNSNILNLESVKHVEPDWHYMAGITLSNPEMEVSGKYTTLIIHSLMEPQYADKGGSFRLDSTRRDRARVVMG